MNKKGILILAVGNAGYGKLAANLATSLKASKCTLPIQLVYTDTAIQELSPTILDMFTHKTRITKDYYFIDNSYEYGFIKCSLDLLTVFEETIYIDADSLASPRRNLDNYEIPYDVCINHNGIFGQNRRHKNDFVDYAWLLKSDFEGFLNTNTILFDTYIYTQTSYIAFRSGEIATKYFEHVRKSFDFAKGIKKKNIASGDFVKYKTHLRRWMEGAVPDEVCFSLGVMTSGIEPYMESFCGFAEWAKNSSSRNMSFYLEGFYFISFACGLNQLSNVERKLYNDFIRIVTNLTRTQTFRWQDKKNFLITDKLKVNVKI